jgi:succinyl-diaminopimelate desuccinylase
VFNECSRDAKMMNENGKKEKAFGFIAGEGESLILDLESGLTGRPAVSPESGGEGELDKCEYLESWLRARGITRLERYDAPDGRAKGGIRPNLIAAIQGRDAASGGGPDSGGRLWIMSHLDVVPPGEGGLWRSDPWTLVHAGDRIIGRGVEDNQQGICSSVLAALSLAGQGIVPPRTVKLLFAADEENGSKYGIDWLLKNHEDLFRGDDMVLVPDGGDRWGTSIEIAEKNLVWARFTVHGKQTHGSMPDLGANAFLAGSDLVLALHYGLSEKFPAHDPIFQPDYSTFQPTKKEANVPNINTIPGEDVFSMDMRILPRYPVKEVFAEIDRIKAGIEAKHKVSVTYTPVQCVESQPTPADSALVKLLAGSIAEVYGAAAKPIGIGGGTVAAYLRNQGIHCAVWCRIDETAHQPNEYALVANILGDARVMALLMLAD